MNRNPNDISNDRRYDLVIDILEHPERYDAEELACIMNDPETRGTYKLLCKINSSVKANKSASRVSVDDEWQRFSEQHLSSHKKFLFFTRHRAATIAILALSSFAAIAIGVAITTSSFSAREHETLAAFESDLQTVEIETPSTQPTIPDSTAIEPVIPILFEDNALEEILHVVAETYGVDIRFNNDATKRLHLYFKFNPALSLDEVIDQLNNFEQINIIKTDKSLIVD